jgi:hypothetical protein
MIKSSWSSYATSKLSKIDIPLSCPFFWYFQLICAGLFRKSMICWERRLLRHKLSNSYRLKNKTSILRKCSVRNSSSQCRFQTKSNRTTCTNTRISSRVTQSTQNKTCWTWSSRTTNKRRTGTNNTYDKLRKMIFTLTTILISRW